MFYAVRIGREPGIYDTWAECQAQVKGFSNNRYKRFSTEGEAWDFICDKEDVDFTGEPFDVTEGTSVYTDGACFNYGKDSETHGIGVWWGHNNPNNISERLHTGRQRIHQAPIHAAVKAVMQAKKMGISKLILHSNSQLLIKGITIWIKRWIRNDWMRNENQPVMNREDFQELHGALVGMHVKWVHVSDHQGNEGMEMADKLANDGANMPLK